MIVPLLGSILSSLGTAFSILRYYLCNLGCMIESIVSWLLQVSQELMYMCATCLIDTKFTFFRYYLYLPWVQIRLMIRILI